MIKSIVLCSLIAVTVQGNCGQCPKAPRFYEELNCSGVMEKQGDCCAVRYDCPDVTIEDLQHQDPTKCYYGGKAFEISQTIFNETWNCLGECTCFKDLDSEPAVFYCDPHICSQSFGSLEDGISWSYSPSHCCIAGTIWNDDRPALHKCAYRGINTVKGEKFTPPDDPCYWCVCDELFRNEVSASENANNCHKLDCGVPHFRREEIKENCAPVYKQENSCCPFEWVCPKDHPHVEIIQTTIPSSDTLVCKFGDKTVKLFEGIETGNKCRTCTCKIPPFLTCIQTPNC